MSSRYGSNINIEVFGESHSREIGVVMRNYPAGATFDPEELQLFLDRRSPGKKGGALRSAASTGRNEKDRVIFRSGVEEADDGMLRIGDGEIVAVIANGDMRSKDYGSFRSQIRPGHADLGAYLKYGKAGLKPGGGEWSGRMTAPMCIAGGIALQLLEKKGIEIRGSIAEIGGSSDEQEIQSILQQAASEKDSVGGIIQCVVKGFPGGVGDAMFQGMEGKISQAVFGVPAVKGIQFGSGFACARMRGSENNDEYYFGDDGRIYSRTNNHGGITGGITTGMDILFQVAMKPTPSIVRPQHTVNIETGQEEVMEIRGRHDVCIVPRAVPVIEAVTALALMDALMDESGLDFALLGDPVEHSLSPKLHGLIGNYGYEKIRVEKDQLKEILSDQRFKGFNVTSPHKRNVIPLMDELSPEAERLQAVNTVVRTRDGRLVGHNTDVAGHMRNLRDTGVTVNGSKVLVLGTGGAASAVVEGLRQMKAGKILVVTRDPARMAKAKSDPAWKGAGFCSYDDLRRHTDADIMINATPVGMGATFGDSPLDGCGTSFSDFKDLKLVEDLIYDPARTKFLQDAEKAGTRTVNGLGMLIGQGIMSSRLWMEEWSMGTGRGDNDDPELMKRIKTSLRLDQLSLVLVGMPGSGKSSVARRTAKVMDREFVDTDKVFTKEFGEAPGQILGDPERGEKVMRPMESKVIKEVCSGRGLVIATGGGAVLRPENRTAIRANSVVVYISRPLSMLSVKNRPLSQGKGVEKLLKERGWIYEKTADFKIHNKNFFGGGKGSYNRDINDFAEYLSERFREYVEDME